MQKQAVLSAIRKRHINRQPLNLAPVKREQPELVRAVYAVEPYWGWKQALEDAGLSYKTIRIHVRETVRCRLCGKAYRMLNTHLLAHQLSGEDYREQFPDADLISEARRAAMMGPKETPPPGWLPHWEPFLSPEYILDRIKEYANQGTWMEASTIGEIDVALMSAVHHHLGISNWDHALRRVGLNPAVYRGCSRAQDFDLADLQAFLQQRHAAGLLSTAEAVLAVRDEHDRRPRVVAWALQRYGDWTAALDAAGVDRSDPLFGGDRYLTKDSVIRDLRRLQDELSDLPHVSVSRLPDGAQLSGAASLYFGSWEAALDAADVPADLRHRITRYESAEEVLAGIAQHRRYGFSVAPLDVYFGTHNNIQLWKAAFRFFPSWHAAVAKAGGTSSQIKQASKTPLGTRDEVLDELRRRSADVTQLSVTTLTSAEADKYLYLMASGFFGDWQSAIRAIGVDPKSYNQKNLNPQRKYLDEADLLEEIQRRQKAGEPLHTRGVTGGQHVDAPLLYTARKLFGSWEAAIRAAGIDYNQIVRKHQDYEALRDRQYKSYSAAEEVTAELRRRQAEGLPLNSRAMTHGKVYEHRDHALYKAAREFFGSWDAALTQAGIDLDAIRPAWVTGRNQRLASQD
ncbi:hypothetical protein [Roseimaritima sediminicola]|uniref:hypothetical protein n=1 Tax=Roseimaritima sediminicola TaxID=2662066 RepID=UPI0012985044|nr:hypothetical protein [Roseimaritima sediminicola]